jgi:hypothetical protein
MPEPLYILGAAPKAQAEVRTLTRQEGVRQVLEHPPFLRYEGWNLVTLEQAELASGPRLHIQNGERKFFDLYGDGTFTAIGTFDGFLGVGRWDWHLTPRVNGLALVEFTYEFVAFYEQLLREYIAPLPGQVRFSVKIRNQHFELEQVEGEPLDRRLLLKPGTVDHPLYDLVGGCDETREAPANPLDESLDVAVAAGEPHLEVGAVAYELVRRVFNWFGFTDDGVPYVTDGGVDADQIRNMRR